MAILLFILGIPVQAGISDLPELKAPLEVPETLVAIRESNLSSQYSDTHCLELLLKKSKEKIGVLCVSKDPKFLSESGVQLGRNQNRDGSTIATGTSSYSMTTMLAKPIRVRAARVDCDEGDGPIYRPTSTCHVAAGTVGDQVIYSNFVLINHVTKRRKVRESDIVVVWKSIKI